MAGAARRDDTTECPAHELEVVRPFHSLARKKDHEGGRLENVLDVCFEVDGRPVIRLGDYGHCKNGAPLDVVFTAAANFTVCGLPVAREGDGMVHEGSIATGSGNMDIGGPSFALPSNFTVNGPPSFRNEVIRDLYFLSTTETGSAVIAELAARGYPLVIDVYPGYDNSTAGSGGPDRFNGVGTGTTIRYAPHLALETYDTNGDLIAMAPQVALAHELIHALHAALGVMPENPDPAHAGTLDPDMVEAAAIGLDGYANDPLTENSLRAELGLPLRGTHSGVYKCDDSSGTLVCIVSDNFRPGEC